MTLSELAMSSDEVFDNDPKLPDDLEDEAVEKNEDEFDELDKKKIADDDKVED